VLQRLRELRKNDQGFTLIELLIVIIILGVLAGIVVFAVGGVTDRGNASACKADVKAVQVAAEAAFAQTGSYPDLDALKPQWLHDVPNIDPTKGEYWVVYTKTPATSTTPASVAVVGHLKGQASTAC
jgi:general secretion pathway protein G